MSGNENSGRKTKNGIMTFDAMISEQEKKRHIRTYKTEAAELAAESITASVSQARQELFNIDGSLPERMSVEDTETLRKVTYQYLISCEKTATVPTCIGLARACGYSETAFNAFKRKKPSHPSTEWLNRFKELCSDVLAQSALRGATNPIVSIFFEKANYGLRDTVTLETAPYENNSIDELSPDELRKKYGSLLDE